MEGLTSDFQLAPLRGRNVFLRPVSPEDYRMLRAADHGGELAVRWRMRGSTASPEQWAQNLWRSVLVQYLVVGLADPSPLGLVVVYKPNFQDGYGYLAVERLGPPRHVPALMLGVALFVDYVFTCWNFHKLYIETAEYNVSQFGSGIGRFLDLEARLRGHLWYAGRRWDQLILALHRETWDREAGRLRSAARSPVEDRVHIRLPEMPGG